MPTIFSEKCSRCWPALCRCPPSTDQIELMKGDMLLLDRELQRENRRAREFRDELVNLARAICEAREARVAAGGFDDLPADLHDLSVKAAAALQLATEERNHDRVGALYAALASKEKNDAK